MPLIYIILFCFFFLLSKAVFGTIKNPISIFCLLWSAIGFGANMCFFDYYAPSAIVNFLIISCCFLSFAFYGIQMSGYKKSFFQNEIFVDETLNINKIVVVNAIAIVVFIPYISKALVLYNTGGMAYLRSESVFTSGFYAVLMDSIVRPLFTATTILTIVYSFTSNRRKSKIFLLIITVIANTELVIISAGRAPIVNIVFYLIIAMVLFHGRSVLNILKRGRKYLILALLAFCVVIFITSQRSLSGSQHRFLYNTYVYYFSGPSYLTQLLENVTEYGFSGKHLYGGATFGFLSNIWSDMMIFLTGKSQGSLYLLGSVLTNKQYQVGSFTSINAMYTCFYPFIIDFSYFGIIIGPLVIAGISSRISKKVYKSQSMFTISLYVYWTYVLIRTVFKWDLVNIDFTVIIIALWYFTKKQGNMRDKGI